MEGFNAEAFTIWLATLGVVIAVAALLSGVIDRTGMPQVAVFLALGAALGPHGLDLMDVGLDSPLLRVVATLSLALVLFTDAVSLNIAEVRKNASLALRLLGPGTLVSAGLLTLAGWALLGLSLPLALILGASLASTDPVLLRGLLRGQRIPAQAKLALRLESGLNDVVVLPIVVVAMTFASPAQGHVSPDWGALLLSLFVLGPAAGAFVGLGGVGALDKVRAQVGVRRDYESLYSLGLAFAAFAAAEAVHGSGFLAAFTAGLLIAWLDVELCDCFLEYGEVTAEMLLLLTFVLFGTSLIWEGLSGMSLATVAFAAFAVLIRMPVYLLSLVGSGVDRRSRLLIAWFGGRGLSSLLLVLLAVFAGVPGSEELFRICSVVVLLSVVVHGGSPMVLAWISRRRDARRAGAGESKALVASEPAHEGADPSPDGTLPASREVITIDELRALWAAHAPVVVVDVRTQRTYDQSDQQATDAVRLDPEQPAREAESLELPRTAWIIPYCT